MNEIAPKKFLSISEDAQAGLIAGARDAQRVRGLTHGYYKYPARFSPAFASAAIEAFTKAGDLVLDPHVGGGTTIVEAIAAGRQAVGVDISTLAEFVTKTKATIFSENELDGLEEWSAGIGEAVDIHGRSTTLAKYEVLGYYRHLNHPSRWRLRKAIEQGLEYASKLSRPKLEAFGRCVMLRTAQWALDGRRSQASIEEFRIALKKNSAEMVRGARELRAAAKANGRGSIAVLCRSAAGIETDHSLKEFQAPRLVVTSPPYPGVHVLYHRWQVDGGKEAPLPFMIANKLDGAGGSHYTMGDRKYPQLATYFANIKATMSSVAALADRNTTVVQMIAFSEVHWQLPRYLETMQEAGLTEVFLPAIKHEGDGRLWRSVPGRRWYSDQRGETPGSKEVVLIHRKAQAASVCPTRSLTSISSSARSPRL